MTLRELAEKAKVCEFHGAGMPCQHEDVNEPYLKAVTPDRILSLLDALDEAEKALGGLLSMDMVDALTSRTDTPQVQAAHAALSRLREARDG